MNHHINKIQLFGAALGVVLALGLSGCASDDGLQFNSSAEWVAQSKTGNNLPLADQADVWSDVKNFNAPTGTLGIQSKFTKHYGTTCVYDVQFSNNGTSQIKEAITLGTRDTAAVYGHRLTRIELAPGAKKTYEMEKRECGLHFGESKDLKICAQCDAQVIFSH